jgi:DNA invertase Pin-like site-specific DNA recombinase
MTITTGSTAAIYTRISSDPTGQAAGVERQRKACAQLADDLGLTVAGTYEDNDVSAYSGKVRPNFERLLSDAAEGRFEVVIVWAADRLYRRLSDLERIVTSFDAAGVQVAAVKSGEIDLSTADGRLHARLLGSVAQHESEKKSERITARARQRAVDQKRTVTGLLPFGFCWADPNPDDPKRPRPGTRAGLRIDADQAAALAGAYRDIADGRTLRATWKRLGERIDVGKMTATSLGTILRNPRNAGLATYKGEIVGEAADGLRIVDRDLWEKVNVILSDPKRRTSPGRPANTPYGGGLLRCGKCGGPLASGSKHDASGRTPTYVCSMNRCMSKRRRRIDATLTETIAAVLEGLHAAGLLSVAALAADDHAAGLRTQAAALEDRLDTLAGLVASGDLDALDYAKASKRIRDDLDTITAKLRKTSTRPALASISDDPVSAFTAADNLTKRAIAAELLTRVDVAPGADPRLILVWADWLPAGLPAEVTLPDSPALPHVDSRREKVAEMYASGITAIAALARELGTSRETIRKDLKALGLYGEAGR